MTRGQLEGRIDRAWRAFNTSYAGLSDPELIEPGVTGDWSVKDIVAHVTTWEMEALEHLPAIMSGGSVPKYSVTYGGIDAFNAIATERYGHLSAAQVFDRQHRVHADLMRFLAHVTEVHFATETRFRRRLRLDTYGHYPKHAAAVRRWRELRSR